MALTKSSPQKRNWTLILLLAILILANFIFAFSYGPRLSPDSYYYSNQADRIISFNFDLGEFLSETDMDRLPLFRLSFLYLLSGIKLLVGDLWPETLIVINLLLSSVAFIYLFRMIQQLSKGYLVILLSFFFILFVQDFRLWIAFALTDTIYSSLVFIFFYWLASKSKIAKQRSLFYVLGIILSILFISLLRPVFPPFVATFILYLLWSFGSAQTKDSEAVFKKKFFVSLVIISTFGALFIALISYLSSAGIFFSDSNLVHEITARFVSSGWIVNARPELKMGPLLHFIDFFKLIMLRFYNYFVFWNRAFSLPHNLVNGIFYIPVYALAALGTSAMFSEKSNLSDQWKNLMALSLMFIFLTAFFHSFYNIDFDWRYRTPILLPIILLASQGANNLLGRYFSKTNSKLQMALSKISGLLSN